MSAPASFPCIAFSALVGLFGAFLRGAAAGLLEECLVVNVGERGARRLGVCRAQFFTARGLLLLVLLQTFLEGALALRQRLGELRQTRAAEEKEHDGEDDHPLPGALEHEYESSDHKPASSLLEWNHSDRYFTTDSRRRRPTRRKGICATSRPPARCSA